MTKKFDHKKFLSTISIKPGVYQMLDSSSKVIYVGKARNLKNRIASYFRNSGLESKTLKMVEKIQSIEISITRSETEALLLEQSLIKTYRPFYNIQLRDDKSYPYIRLTSKDTYPRLTFYRGSRKVEGKLFGPYPSANSTRETLQILQKVFRVRQCEDSYFRNRARPCLQYQIKRCTAPCMKLISSEDYAKDVEHSRLFLEGKSNILTKELTDLMERASEAQDYEAAAKFRDQIIDLRKTQEKQFVTNQGEDADILAIKFQQPNIVVHVIYVRGGRIVGSKNYFPKYPLANSSSEALSAFIAQKYLSKDDKPHIPDEIITAESLNDSGNIQDGLSYLAGKQIKLSMNVRGHRREWIQMAIVNAESALQVGLDQKQRTVDRFMDLQKVLTLDSELSRIECYDISHTAGEGAVGSCVVFDESGPKKSEYRRFNIRDVNPGDDYAAMAQVLDRRFTKLSKENGKIPDIILIDGGKGQLALVSQTLEKFQLQEVQLIGIAKGISRRAGQETIFKISGGSIVEVPFMRNGGALNLLQQVRDEAHRFAITGHRQRRAKARNKSVLDDIPQLGPKRRKELLNHFGGAKQVANASAVEIAKVSGINNKLADNIYAWFHSE